LTTLLGVAAWGTASLLRSWHLPPALVLPGTLAATGLSLLLVCFRPRLFVGEDGEWVLVEVYRRLSRRRIGLPERIPAIDGGPTDGTHSLAATYDPPVCVGSSTT